MAERTVVLEMSEGGACGVSHRTSLGLVIKDLSVLGSRSFIS